MRKKKIFNRILLLIIFLISIDILENMLVVNGQHLENVIYKSDNVILQVSKQAEKVENIVILGSGYSLTVDSNNSITEHDPFMIWPSMKWFEDTTMVISVYYPFLETEELERAGQECATYLNTNLNNNIEKTLIGHSKAGVCFANASRWIESEVNIVTISTPFEGTIVTDSAEFEKNLNVFKLELYHIIFSDHKVDKEIAVNSEFMQQVDYSGLDKHKHINVVATCDKSLNPITLILGYITKGQIIDGDKVVTKQS